MTTTRSSDDARVTFTHPLLKKTPLVVSTRPDLITWAYGLNTQSYPTFGGEVVQILSVYFDDMTISGTVRTVAELERIYSWFIAYMQFATQGRDDPSYNQVPVDFYYPERDWRFSIWPKSLPGFKYGRDVVAPTWTVVAAVKEPDATVAQQIQSVASYNATKTGELATFGAATANFGDTGDLTHNPFADWEAGKDKTTDQTIADAISKTVDTYSSFLGSYSSGALDSIPQFQDISAPRTATANPQTTTRSKKKK